MLEATTMKQPPSRLLLSLILPEELIVEILLRLPVRSILKFRCVCKLWKTLISSSQFVKDHLHNSISDSSMIHQRLVSLTNSFPNFEQEEMVTCSVLSLFKNPSTRAETLSFRVEPNCQIIGSFNGLLCLYDYDGDFRLCNPSTRLTSKKSPHSFWSRQDITHFGFGYDQVKDKYKVLIAIRALNMTKVHTFGTNSWTTIQNPIFSESGDKEGKFVGGTMNWLNKRTGSYGNWAIVSFHMEKETYSEVLLPPKHDGGNKHVLDVLSNCLCFHYFDESHWVLWLMEKQESWTKLMLIPHNRICNFRLFFHPLCISGNGDVLAKCLDPQLVLYNANKGTYNYPKLRGWFRPDMHIYHESLVSP